MIIHIDMDNTLNDFTGGFVKKVNEFTGLNISLPKESQIYYEMHKNIPQLNGEGEALREKIFTSPGFWEILDPLPDAVEVMKLLCQKYETYILTAAWPTDDDCYIEKTRWIRNWLPFFNLRNLITTWNKSLIKGDVLVDDAPTFLESYNAETIAYDFPYNRNVKVTYRAQNWKEVGKILRVA
jgi:5'-nucleotidase